MGTDIEVRQSTELAFLAEDVNLGFEGASPEELQPPRLAILQPTSKLVDGDKIKPGYWWNVGTGEIYGPEIKVSVIIKLNNRLLMVDTPTGRKVDCRSFDAIHGTKYGICAECPKGQWGEQGEPPACSTVALFPALFPGSPVPLALALSRSSMPAAKSILTAARYRNPPRPLFGSVFSLTTEAKTNLKGRYYVPVVKLLGDPTAEDYARARSLYEPLKKLQLNFEVEDEEVAAGNGHVGQPDGSAVFATHESVKGAAADFMPDTVTPGRQLANLMTAKGIKEEAQQLTFLRKAGLKTEVRTETGIDWDIIPASVIEKGFAQIGA